MGFFSNLVKLFNKAKTNNNAVAMPPEVDKLHYFEDFINSLLAENRYIAKSDYKKIIADFSNVQNRFQIISDGGILPEYCNKHSLDLEKTLLALETLEKVEEMVDKHNAEYIEKAKIAEKNYLDKILHSIDPSIMLDENQREVVLTDEDYCLVIAGAGAGKTTTVAAKVKYLVDKKNVDPKQILVISFTNKAVEELQEKINKSLLISCPITTFHSTGNAIIRKRVDQKLNIVDSSKLYFVLMDYFRGSLLHNERMVNNLILFFGSYFDAPYEGNDLNSFFNSVAKARYETLKSDLNEYIHEISDTRSKKKVSGVKAYTVSQWSNLAELSERERSIHTAIRTAPSIKTNFSVLAPVTSILEICFRNSASSNDGNSSASAQASSSAASGICFAGQALLPRSK